MSSRLAQLAFVIRELGLGPVRPLVMVMLVSIPGLGFKRSFTS